MTRMLLTLMCVSLAARAAPGQGAMKPEDILGQDTEISLQQAVELGLEYNLNLQVIRNEPALAREDVRAAEGVFDPLVLGGFNQDHIESPVASSVQSFFGTTGNRTTDDGRRYTGGLTGVLPWGASYSSGYSFRRLDSDSGLNSLKPQFSADWSSSITIPLLRGLYWSTPDLIVRQTVVGQHISDATFHSLLSNGVLTVESFYWRLSASRAFERATSNAVDTAKDLLEQTKVRYQVGTVSRVLVTQAEANLAQRQSQHIIALNEAKSAQDDLLTVILAPGINDYSTTTVRTEEPTFVPYPVNPEESVAKARSNRPELVVSELGVEQAEIQESYAWNQTLPSFNVGASYSMDGLSGKQKVPAGTLRPGLATPGPASTLVDPDGIPGNGDEFFTNPIVPQTRQADFGFGTSAASANDNFFAGNGFHSWGFGAAFSYPLGNETADARHVHSKIELRRAKTLMRRTEQTLVLEVRSAVRALQSSIDLVESARRARAASEETLHAEEERLRLGDSTPHNVQQFQDDLLQAQVSEITALQGYRTAISRLEYAQGTLLEARGISVEKERERGMDEY
ncbi:MAG TPA: TolC family protein [Myxococcota bacterium]|nr:TolC family protein [Myxococcota bacterium]